MIDWNDRSWISYVGEQVWSHLPASSLKSRTSTEILCRCPICGDSKKNATKRRGYFYLRTGTYHCFNCDANLTGLALLKAICSQETVDQILQDYRVLHFDRTIRGMDRADGSPSMGETRSRQWDFEILSPSPSYRVLTDAGWKWPTPLTDAAKRRLDDRQIPLDSRSMLSSIQDRAGNEFILIRYVYDENTIYHQLDNFNKVDVPGWGQAKYIFPSGQSLNGQSKPVFNLDSIDPSFPYVFCTEGVYDSLFLRNGVSLGGRNLTDYQYRMLKSTHPRHKIVLAFDNDAPGRESSLKYADRYDVSFLNVYDLLNVCHAKDINEFVRKTGRADVFRDRKTLERLVMSPFAAKMRLQLGT